MEKKGFSRADIAKAIKLNDATTLTGILDEVDSAKPWRNLTSVMDAVLRTALTFAAAQDHKDNLSLRIADELIAHAAPYVDVYGFCAVVVETAEIEPASIVELPVHVLNAINQNEYSDEVAELITNLNEAQLLTMMQYLYDHTEKICYKFSLPILQATYYSTLIPSQLCLAYVGLCLNQPIVCDQMIVAAIPAGVEEGLKGALEAFFCPHGEGNMPDISDDHE